MLIQVNSDLLLAATLLSALRALRRLAVSVFLLAMLGTTVVSGEGLIAVRTLVRLFARVLTTMMIPRILSPEAHVAILACEWLSTGVQQNVVVQRLGIVESLATLRAFVSLLAAVFALDVIYQQLLDPIRHVADVALKYRIHLALVHLLLVRLERHLMLKLLVTFVALVPRLLLRYQRVLPVDPMGLYHVVFQHTIRRQILRAHRTGEQLRQRYVPIVLPVFLQVLVHVLLLAERFVAYLATVTIVREMGLSVKLQRIRGHATQIAYVALIRPFARVRPMVFLQSRLQLKRLAAQLADMWSRPLVHEEIMFVQRILRAELFAAGAADEFVHVLVVSHLVKLESLLAHKVFRTLGAMVLPWRYHLSFVTVDHQRQSGILACGTRR